MLSDLTPNTPEGAAVLDAVAAFLARGGPAIWAIAALSVAMVALALWKLGRLTAGGAWSGGGVTDRAVALWSEGRAEAAIALLDRRRSYRARLARAAMGARSDPGLTTAAAEAETQRVARALLAEARGGLRGLELIATIAPLLGLLGTVLGMITAFRALEATGARADPAVLAGGIWEALLTTAAGMAVAIPASVALSWFDSVAERLRHDMEDAATRIFLRHPGAGAPPRLAAVSR
jgi:biopolymer transport protein ExbB